MKTNKIALLSTSLVLAAITGGVMMISASPSQAGLKDDHCWERKPVSVDRIHNRECLVYGLIEPNNGENGARTAASVKDSGLSPKSVKSASKTAANAPAPAAGDAGGVTTTTTTEETATSTPPDEKVVPKDPVDPDDKVDPKDPEDKCVSDCGTPDDDEETPDKPKKDKKAKGNNGGGNDADGVDSSNPAAIKKGTTDGTDDDSVTPGAGKGKKN